MKYLTALTLSIVSSLSLLVTVPTEAKPVPPVKPINLNCANAGKRGFIKLDAYQKVQPNSTIKLVLVIPDTEVKRFLMLTVKAKYIDSTFYTLGTDTDESQVFACTPSDGKMIDLGVIVGQ